MKNFLRKYGPYIAAFVLFVSVCYIYFKPQYEGMSLRQSDMVQVSGMGADISRELAASGEKSQWTGGMFGGMPAYLIDFDYQGRLVRDISKTFFFMGEPASYIFLAMSCFFIMLLCFGVDPRLAIAGALAYGFSTYFLIIIEVGHITKMVALAYAPPMVGAVFLAYRRNLWAGAALAAFFGSLQIGANHLQITYYFAFVLAALIINEAVRAIREKRVPDFIKRTAVLMFAAVIAVGSNIILLWYLNDYSKDTMRGGSELVMEQKSSGLQKDYVTAWSYGKSETFNLFIPNFTGGSSQGGFSAEGEVAESLDKYNARSMATTLPGYWGPQPGTSGPVYIGAVMVFLFVLGMFMLSGRAKWWIFGATLLAVLLAWGHNFMWFTDLFYNYFPYYNKFRTVSMILVIAQWSLPLMSMLVLQKLWSGGVPGERFNKSLKYSLIITGGTALFFALFGGMLFDFSSAVDSQLPGEVAAAMRSERASMLRADSLRSLVFVLLAAGAVWMFYRGRIKRWMFASAVALLVAADMIGVGTRYLNYDTFMPEKRAKAIVASAADKAIMQDTVLGFRVANFTVSTFMDATTSYFHRSVGGYHAAKLSRYQDIIDRHLSKMNWNVFNMLNTKYIITPGEDGQPVAQQNPGALGPAWFVRRIEFVQDAAAEIAALDDFDPAATVVIDKRFAPLSGEIAVVDTTAHISLVAYRPHHLTYRYTSQTGGVAVFSEIYYEKGWTAYIDGVETPHFRANYILRAMRLPAGSHTVEFRFEAPHYKMLATISYICSLILIGGLIAVSVKYIFLNDVKRKKNQNQGT